MALFSPSCPYLYMFGLCGHWNLEDVINSTGECFWLFQCKILSSQHLICVSLMLLMGSCPNICGMRTWGLSLREITLMWPRTGPGVTMVPYSSEINMQ